MINEEWTTVRRGDTNCKQDDNLQQLLKVMLDSSCPIKIVKLRTEDKPYITQKIKVLNLQRRREYRKHGKSLKYEELKVRYDRKLMFAAQNYLDRTVRNLKQTDPGKVYTILK
jgi:hypothetical protein